MKNKFKIISWFLAAIFCMGCEKEDTLTPSEGGILSRFEFPQGNQSWDETAKEIYNRFGVYVIYKDLSNPDFNHSWTGAAGLSYFGGSLNDQQAEIAVNFLKRHIFAYLDRRILAKIFPPYWYLAYNFYSEYVFIPGLPPSRVPQRFIQDGLDFWVTCLFWDPSTGFSEPADTPQTAEEWRKYRGEIMQLLLASACDKGNIVAPAGFHDGIDYQKKLSSSSDAYKEDPDFYIVRGFPGIRMGSVGFSLGKLSSITNTNPANNFVAYLQMCIRYTKEEYEEMYPSSKSCYRLIWQKRNLLIDYMKTQYGIDLEAIARGPETE